MSDIESESQLELPEGISEIGIINEPSLSQIIESQGNEVGYRKRILIVDD